MLPNSDDLSDLRDRAILYAKTLRSQRQQLAPPEFWYPYGSINNFDVLNKLLTGQNRNIFRDTIPKRAADIGAADGDVSFFMEREGWEMTIIDNPPTNWNGLRGAKLFKEATGSAVQILEMDLDSQFLLRDKYDVVFFMGILYHLKNPFYVLEELSKSARYAFLSTRIMRWSKPPPQDKLLNLASGQPAAPRRLMEDLPVAYLLGRKECNNDNTNYWIFSDAGLRRILDRTGWNIKDYLVIGETEDADPFSEKNDARSFSLIKSRRFEN